MSGHYLRKRTRLGHWSFALASFAAMTLCVGLVFFRLAILDLRAFSFTVAAVAALVVVALLLALVAIAKAWRRGYRGGGRALAGFALAAIVGIPFAIGIALAIEYPTSSMAQTDGIAAEMTAARSGGDEAQSLLLGRDFQATAADVYGAARASIEASGWEIVDVEASALPQPAEGDLGVSGTVLVPIPTLRDSIPEDDPGVDPFAAIDSDRYTITAVAYAPIVGFPSDVTVRIAEVNGTSLVDMRSVSRDVPRDLGQNRRFVEGFFARLDAAMTLLQSGPGAED